MKLHHFIDISEILFASGLQSGVHTPQKTCKRIYGGSEEYIRTFLLAQTVKHLLTMQETRVQSLGLPNEDLLEKEMATHSSILAWEIPWTEKPGRLQSMGSQKVGHD